MTHDATVELPSSADTPAESRVRRDKRNLILDSAVRVFARLGYHGARISDIATEAGIAYGLVYHYFKNKEEILDTVFEERWADFVAAVEGIAAGGAATGEKLHAVVALVLDTYRARPEWMKVFVLEIQRTSRITDPRRRRAVARLFQAVARILRDGQAAGELRDDLDPEVAGTVLLGALELVITARVLEMGTEARRGASLADAARTVIEIFLRGVEAAPAR